MEIIREKRKRGKVNVTCGATPHHIMWDQSKMKGKDGIKYKMNPPLRFRIYVEELREYLLNGDINWIETDHAKHTEREKTEPPYLSGYPSLELYREFVEEFLPGLGMGEEQIRAMTRDNIVKALKIEV